MSDKKLILLYNPPSEFYAMPLGLLSVGSAVHGTAGINVRILDSRIDPDAEEVLLELAPQASCVGMTVFSGPPIGPALALARAVKRQNPGLPVVWGGWHPSIFPEQCIDSGEVDAVAIGQGEGSFAELVAAIDRPREWEGIAGLCVKTETGTKRTPPRPLADMNSFPPVCYELLDVESYFRHKGHRQIDYSSSRGCPYRCTFCADPIIYKSKWTGLKAARTVEELMKIHHRYRMDEVFFLDDDLFASLKRIQALAEALIEAKVPFGWKGTARADELCRLPEDFFGRLRASGCRRINVGAESGSQPILDQIKKQYRVEQIVEAGRRAAGAGLGVAYSFITGFPGETEEDFSATLDVIKSVRRIDTRLEATLYFYSPYPGTELVQQLEARGMRLPIKLEEWSDFSIESAWLPPSRLKLSRRVRNLNFYIRHAYRTGGGPVRRLLQAVARRRCDHEVYGLAIEPYLAELVGSRG